MGYLKALISEILKGFAKIRLETGEYFWIPATPKMTAKERVVVGWDYTHNKPATVKTKYDVLDIEEPNEHDVFFDDRCRVVDERCADVFSMSRNTDGRDVNDV